MEVRSKYESALILDKVEIIESSFRKKDGSLDDLELGVQVDHSLNKIGDDKFELILTTKVADQDEKVCVWVKGRAIFNTQQENMSILERNAIAILFPYIRSYISTITTQPGMAPILLPAMNIVAMLNDQKEKININAVYISIWIIVLLKKKETGLLPYGYCLGGGLVSFL